MATRLFANENAHLRAAVFCHNIFHLNEFEPAGVCSRATASSMAGTKNTKIGFTASHWFFDMNNYLDSLDKWKCVCVLSRCRSIATIF